MSAMTAGWWMIPVPSQRVLKRRELSHSYGYGEMQMDKWTDRRTVGQPRPLHLWRT